MLKIIIVAVAMTILALAGGSVLKTGMTTCYDIWTDVETNCALTEGQDGNYQKGLERNFVRISSPFSSSATVTDTVTGLIWKDDDTVVGNIDWQDAALHCLKLQGYWRLPTIIELMTIADYSATPTIANIFKKTTSGRFWSNTDYLSEDRMAWVFGFDYGTASFPDKNDLRDTRCISGESATSPGHYIKTRIGLHNVVYDQTTNFTWEDRDEPINQSTKRGWSGALSHCQNLIYADKDDWRLPNINELASIIDLTRKPALHPIFDNKETSSPYWSSTTNTTVFDIFNGEELYYSTARTVEFDKGEVGYNDKDDPLHARCIRDGQINIPINPSIIMYLLN